MDFWLQVYAWFLALWVWVSLPITDFFDLEGTLMTLFLVILGSNYHKFISMSYKYNFQELSFQASCMDGLVGQYLISSPEQTCDFVIWDYWLQLLKFIFFKSVLKWVLSELYNAHVFGCGWVQILNNPISPQRHVRILSQCGLHSTKQLLPFSS